MARTNDALANELQTMRSCANQIHKLEPEAQARVIAWLHTAAANHKPADPRQVDMFGEDKAEVAK